MAQSTYGVLHVEGEGVVGYSIPVNLDPLCKAVVRKKCLGGGGGGRTPALSCMQRTSY